MTEDAAIYNSRITKGYIEFLKREYPEIELETLLHYAEMPVYAVDDEAHWFTQRQVDRFHDILVEKTGNPHIARDVGRFAASSDAMGVAKKYTLGLVRLSTAYLLMARLYPMISRGADITSRKVAPNKIELVVTPRPGVQEKLYQCENRMGTFEALARFFTDKFATIEHPECFHNGAKACRYMVSWEKTPSSLWKMARNYAVLFGVLLTGASLFLWHVEVSIAIAEIFAFSVLALSVYADNLEKQELAKTLEQQGDTAKKLLDEMNIRYNNALLVEEIGRATSEVLEVDQLLEDVMAVISKRLDFDRGVIWLANQENEKLIYKAGYGYSAEEEKVLKKAEFHLDNPESKGFAVQAFKHQKGFLLDDVEVMKDDLSTKSYELISQFNATSVICVPLVYKGRSLGVLVVDNVETKRSLNQSDMNLLMGVASQTAVSIVNARSFQEVQNSERKYRELVENANSIIMRVDPEFRVTFFNEFAQNFFGYKEGEIIGRNVHETLFSSKARAGLNLYRLFKNMRGKPQSLLVAEGECTRHDGRQVIVAWTFKPVFKNTDQEIQQILCIGNDVTELKKAADANRALEIKLQQAQKMEAIGTLAGGIAHDFNNILTAIIGYAEIAKLRLTGESRARESLEEVLRASDRAKDLVGQILSFSRQGQQQLLPAQIGPIVKEALKLLRASLPSTIQIKQDIDPDAGVVKADPTQIHQVLMNLCTNALHAMQERGGILTVSLRNWSVDEGFAFRSPGLEPGKYVRLQVQDTGYGIAPEVLDRIFEPYFTTKKTGEGTGLGLAVVHGIVKSHEGVITVSSNREDGTAFDVFLPVIEGGELPVLQPSEDLPRGDERILFVDDEHALVHLGKEMLEFLGYRVNACSSSLQALQLFRSRPNDFDLVITDLTMPHLTGEGLAQEVLSIREDIPIILCTGFKQKMTERYAAEIGLRALLIKPLRMREMADTVRRVLDKGRLLDAHPKA